ncbi:hypothetical protein [Gilliamella apicola]|nr:hypothetical protein [Gilliamella apicola]
MGWFCYDFNWCGYVYVSVRNGNDGHREYYLCTTPDDEQYTIDSEAD